MKDLLTWPEVFEAVDMSFRSVSKDVPEDQNVPRSSQPARSFTWGANKSGKECPIRLYVILITSSNPP